MRRLDEFPIDPEIAAQLDAIDATLAGEPVDPQYAELAELALLLAAERPVVDPEFAAAMDTRVQTRFTRDGAVKGARGVAPPSLGQRMLSWMPQLAGLAAGLAAVAVLVVVIGSGGGSISSSSSSSASGGGVAESAAASTTSSGPPRAKSASGSANHRSAAPAPQGNILAAPSVNGHRLAPPSNGRKVVQSAQLALTTVPTRVDDVAQEVFNVVGQENGIVRRSLVTATGGTDGYAQFVLSIPSGSLQDTMSALSRLQYAHVASRTDTSQDINDSYVATKRALADARALRTALLKQLATAVTQQQIDSLTARIHDAEASISSDEATLNGFNRQVNFSQVSVSINAVPAPVQTHKKSTGFTLGRAAHDAGRVLTVGAGVALIVLAVLVPLGLVAGFLWWVAHLLRRRRREHALDMA
jgi:hypothetical protein